MPRSILILGLAILVLGPSVAQAAKAIPATKMSWTGTYRPHKVKP